MHNYHSYAGSCLKITTLKDKVRASPMRILKEPANFRTNLSGRTLPFNTDPYLTEGVSVFPQIGSKPMGRLQEHPKSYHVPTFTAIWWKALLFGGRRTLNQ